MLPNATALRAGLTPCADRRTATAGANASLSPQPVVTLAPARYLRRLLLEAIVQCEIFCCTCETHLQQGGQCGGSQGSQGGQFSLGPSASLAFLISSKGAKAAK